MEPKFRNIDEWRVWQASCAPWPRRARARFTRNSAVALSSVTVGGSAPVVLVAVDSVNTSSDAAVLDPLRVLVTQVPLAILTPSSLLEDVHHSLAGIPTHKRSLSDDLFSGVRCIISAGAHLEAGRFAANVAARRKIPYFMVQHGLITPFEPPIPERFHVFAWTNRDAEIWTRFGTRVTATSVGSQLLSRAVNHGDAHRQVDVPPVFLGQLHGAELDRRVTVRTVERLLEETEFSYRPHPAEQDLMSRIQHRRWRQKGLKIMPSRSSLRELSRPTVGIFSTGLLETAAAGCPSWGFCVDPPMWVEELWDAYGIQQWGSSRPTPPPRRVEIAPATAIADAVLDLV